MNFTRKLSMPGWMHAIRCGPVVRQEPYINSMLAQHALALLARLFRLGEIAYHGAFVSQETGRVNPLPVEHDTWTRILHVKSWRKGRAGNDG